MNDDGISPLADHGRELRMTMPGLIQSAGRAGAYVAGGERGKMRASDSDRDGVVEVLNMAFSEGRLSKDEYDGRLESALSARTYADRVITRWTTYWNGADDLGGSFSRPHQIKPS